jgi:hypothetical protein
VCDVQELFIKGMNGSNESNNLFTGLACVDDCTLAVTSHSHVALIKLIPQWSRVYRWPCAFTRAAQTTLLIAQFGEARARAECRGKHGLWSLPKETIDVIIQKSAGSQSDWLRCEDALNYSDSFYGVPRDALTHPLIQESLLGLYHTGAWLFDPESFRPLDDSDSSVHGDDYDYDNESEEYWDDSD